MNPEESNEINPSESLSIFDVPDLGVSDPDETISHVLPELTLQAFAECTEMGQQVWNSYLQILREVNDLNTTISIDVVEEKEVPQHFTASLSQSAPDTTLWLACKQNVWRIFAKQCKEHANIIKLQHCSIKVSFVAWSFATHIYMITKNPEGKYQLTHVTCKEVGGERIMQETNLLRAKNKSGKYTSILRNFEALKLSKKIRVGFYELLFICAHNSNIL